MKNLIKRIAWFFSFQLMSLTVLFFPERTLHAVSETFKTLKKD